MIVPLVLLSGLITPPFAFLLCYFNITDQYRENADGEMILVETKAEAQKDVAHQLVRLPIFWIWVAYASILGFASLISYNFFGFGDWFIAL